MSSSQKPPSASDSIACIREIMKPSPACFEPETGVEILLQALLEGGMSAVVIKDGEQRPLGTVTKTQALRMLENLGDSSGPGANIRARSMMTPTSFCLREDDSVAQAAALMAFESVHQIPIVDEHGRMAGLLSALDIMRWLARREGYLIP